MSRKLTVAIMAIMSIFMFALFVTSSPVFAQGVYLLSPMYDSLTTRYSIQQHSTSTKQISCAPMHFIRSSTGIDRVTQHEQEIFTYDKL